MGTIDTPYVVSIIFIEERKQPIFTSIKIKSQKSNLKNIVFGI
jgi:hypothetical protein